MKMLTRSQRLVFVICALLISVLAYTTPARAEEEPCGDPDGCFGGSTCSDYNGWNSGCNYATCQLASCPSLNHPSIPERYCTASPSLCQYCSAGEDPFIEWFCAYHISITP